ncbi:MAG: stage II sporulation protein M [Methanocellales archaeon]|nr:stage II sporulation protein M [Methanocellales archaeon]MDD3291347.1 stage II sporulation protein M [Methanocellales archaeon]MDD5234763.1 stage II sporulation protein M [Methanocellales archaeon]MDD5484886.1 stage II sporulation protein M [Methanocellales archaeon]
MNRINTKEAIAYLSYLKGYILFVSLIFVLSILMGYWYFSLDMAFATQTSADISEMFAILESLHPLIIMVIIFLNNSIKCLIVLLLGIGFGLVPLVFLTYNGFLIGVVVLMTERIEGTLYVLAAIVPHGIIELPMVLLSAAIGIRLGHDLWSALMGKKADIKKDFKKGMLFYMHWILPLLFLAAAVETFLTPLIVIMVIG